MKIFENFGGGKKKQAQLNELSKSFRDLESEKESEISALEHELSQHVDEKARLESELVKKEEEVQALKRKMSRLEQERSPNADEKTQLMATIEKLKKELADMESEIQALNTTLSQLKKDHSQQLSEKAKSMKVADKLKSEVRALKTENKELKKNLSTESGKVQKLEMEMVEKNDEVQELKETLSQQKDQISKLQSELIAEKNKCEDLQKQANDLIAENSKKAVELKEKGQNARDAKQFVDAIEFLSEALGCERSGNNNAKVLARLMNSKGSCYFFLEKYDKAIQFYTAAIELDPSNAVYYHNCSLSYYELKNFKLALQDTKKSLELKPDYESAKALLVKIESAMKAQQ